MLCYDTLMFQARAAERCPSGRRSTIGNRVFRQNRDRGFKSHSLRHSIKVRSWELGVRCKKNEKERGEFRVRSGREENRNGFSANSELYLGLLIVGSCATKDYKPRQVRKEAAVVIPFVCRRGAWLSTSYNIEAGSS